MFQYAKKTLIKIMEKEELIKRKKAMEKNGIDRKIGVIKSHENLEKAVKSSRISVGVVIGGLILVAGGIILLASVAHAPFWKATLTIAIGDGFLGFLFSPTFIDHNSNKKELASLEKEYQKFKEDEENLKEHSKTLQNEITSVKTTIDKYQDELGRIYKIEEVEEYLNTNNIHTPFYQADTEEEYQTLLDNQSKCEALWEEFMNERVDYTKVHLETNEFDQTRSKTLTKKF